MVSSWVLIIQMILLIIKYWFLVNIYIMHIFFYYCIFCDFGFPQIPSLGKSLFDHCLVQDHLIEELTVVCWQNMLTVYFSKQKKYQSLEKQQNVSRKPSKSMKRSFCRIFWMPRCFCCKGCTSRCHFTEMCCRTPKHPNRSCTLPRTSCCWSGCWCTTSMRKQTAFVEVVQVVKPSCARWFCIQIS